MDRFRPTLGTPAAKQAHVIFMQDAVQRTFQDAHKDLIALSANFKVSGCVVTETPSGPDITYSLTAGSVCLNGEFLPFAAQSVTKAPTQVVFIRVQENNVDILPVTNALTGTEYVMRQRVAELAVANVYPNVGEYMMVTSPSKAELELQKYAGRIVMPGSIMPYFGDMADFNGNGLGVNSMAGWAVCNGLNGTPDLRGVTLMGATNVPASGGGSPAHAGVSNTTDVGDEVGADSVQLVANNLPEHTHPYVDENVSGTGSDVPGGGGFARPGTPKTTGVNTTTNTPVDVRQSSFALVYIMSLAS